MQQFIFFFLLFISITTLQAQSLRYDEVRLKNGNTIRGMVDAHAAKDSVRIRTTDGAVKQFGADQVESVSLGRYTGIEGFRSPGIAFVCSFLVPGAGQHYNGQYLKGAVMEAVFGLGLFLAIDSKELSGKTTGVILMGTSSLCSMIDAPLSAYSLNEEKARQVPRASLPLLRMQLSDKTAKVGLYRDKYATGAQFTLEF